MATNDVQGHSSTSKRQENMDKEAKVKVICLGDSAVGKSKLVERFLMDGYKPQQLSTYALTLFKYHTKIDGREVAVDYKMIPRGAWKYITKLADSYAKDGEFWDTAGQERFSSMHPSYYHQANACILVFDITRKITYKNLAQWYKELRQYRDKIPCIVVANKIDVDCNITSKSFNFPKKYKLPFYFVSASDGTNVVKVFREAIKLGYNYKENSSDFMDEVMRELENFDDADFEETDNSAEQS